MAGLKWVTYDAGEGARAGVVRDETVFDAAGLTGQASDATMLGILADWDAASARIARAAAAADAGKGRPLAQCRLLAPVRWPSAIYCAGSNYGDHAAEMAKAHNRAPEPDPKSLGLQPWHFIKASRALADPDATVHIPPYATMLDWEVELVGVIGRPAKNVPVEKALDHVAGYTIANDLSVRNMSRRPNVPDTSAFKADWLSHKSFDGSCPLGPWMVAASEIPDPQALGLKLWVNDAIKQDSNTRWMIFTLAEQIAHLSARITLHPGDLILTGTPSGVGMSRQEFLKAGDRVKLWIENIGTLANSFAG